MATSSSWSTSASSSLFTSTSITWGTSSVSVTLPGGYYGSPYVGAYSPGLSVSGSGTSWTVNVGSLGVGTYFVRWTSANVVSPNTTNYYYSGIFITISAAAPSPVYISTSDSYPDFGQGFTITATCSGAARMSLWRSLNGGSSFTKIVQDDASNGTLTRNETASSTYPNLAYYSYGANDNWSSSSQSATIYLTAVTPYGTLLSTYCSGYNYYGTYANGTGGSYDALIESNSTSCGYVAVTAPTSISFSDAGNEAAADSVTVTGSGGSGGDIQVSNDNSNWYANGTAFSQTRNTTVTYYARRQSVSSTSSTISANHSVYYISPNTGASGTSVSIGAADASASIGIVGGVATKEAYSVCTSNAYTTNSQVVANRIAAWTPYANNNQSITSSLPAQGATNTYYVYAYRYATYGGAGQYYLAGSFTITRYIASGTLLSTYCSGVDKYGTYANGSGGTYNALIQSNSPDCGYVATSYSLTGNASVNEGSAYTATFTGTGTNVPTSATYYWRVTPTSDFGAAYEGSFATTNKTKAFTVTPTADQQTEGAEGATLTVYSDSGRTNALVSKAFTINDTSTGGSATESITIDGMQSGTTYINVFAGQSYQINVSGNYYQGSVTDLSNLVSFSPTSWFGTGYTVLTADTVNGYGSTYTSGTSTSTYIQTITAPGGGTTYTNKLMITTFPPVVLPSSTSLSVAGDYVQQPNITVTYSGNSGGNLYYQITTTTGATGTWALAPASPFTINPGISRGSSTTAYIHWKNVPTRPDGSEVGAGAAYSYADTSAAVNYLPTALNATAGSVTLNPSATTYNHSVTSGNANQYYKGELSGVYYGTEVYNDLQLSGISTGVVPRGDRKTFNLYTVLPIAKGGDGVYKDTTDNFYVRRQQVTPTIAVSDNNASADNVTTTVTITNVDGIIDNFQFSEDGGSTWVNVAGTSGSANKTYTDARGTTVNYAGRVTNAALGVTSDSVATSYTPSMVTPTDITFSGHTNNTIASEYIDIVVTGVGGYGGTLKVSNNNSTWDADNVATYSVKRGTGPTFYAKRFGVNLNSGTYSEAVPTIPYVLPTSATTTAATAIDWGSSAYSVQISGYVAGHTYLLQYYNGSSWADIHAFTGNETWTTFSAAQLPGTAAGSTKSYRVLKKRSVAAGGDDAYDSMSSWVVTRSNEIVTAPTDIVFGTVASTASSSTTLTVTASGGTGGTIKVSSNGTTWVANGSTFTVTRGSTPTFYARREGDGATSGNYSEAHPGIPYLQPDLAVTVAGSPFTVGYNTTSLNVAITGVGSDERVRVNLSTSYWTATANGDATISVTTPANGSSATYTVQIRRDTNTGGDGTTWYNSNTTFVINRNTNSAPTIDSFSASPSNTIGPQTVTLYAACSDADGSVDSITITQVSGTTVTLSTPVTSGLGTSSATSSRTFTSPDANGTLVFQVSATDDYAGATGTAQVTVVTNETGTVVNPPSGDGYGLEVYGPNQEMFLSISDKIMNLSSTGTILIPAYTLSNPTPVQFPKNGGDVVAVLPINNYTNYFSYLTAANITWVDYGTTIGVTATRASQDTNFGYNVAMSIDVLVVTN